MNTEHLGMINDDSESIWKLQVGFMPSEKTCIVLAPLFHVRAFIIFVCCIPTSALITMNVKTM
jgi:hypothetical protein